ncbi:MAG: hypothetical protein F6K56_44800 [Moorea sp. SIO3G5]|nr:hypothetical protein [Moorena sp. SIO3G5]
MFNTEPLLGTARLGIVTGKMPVPLPTPDSRLGIVTGKMPVPLPTPINLDFQIKYSKMVRN